uniref:Uncharacterized protein n=1 Tax=Molossus molossus TaxID=27622 RepID=A0A7J8C8K3_MOLMO|nr:hypothetical protein HJG59_009850 [Molossus molossus]
MVIYIVTAMGCSTHILWLEKQLTMMQRRVDQTPSGLRPCVLTNLQEPCAALQLTLGTLVLSVWPLWKGLKRSEARRRPEPMFAVFVSRPGGFLGPRLAVMAEGAGVGAGFWAVRVHHHRSGPPLGSVPTEFGSEWSPHREVGAGQRPSNNVKREVLGP